MADTKYHESYLFKKFQKHARFSESETEAFIKPIVREDKKPELSGYVYSIAKVEGNHQMQFSMGKLPELTDRRQH